MNKINEWKRTSRELTFLSADAGKNLALKIFARCPDLIDSKSLHG